MTTTKRKAPTEPPPSPAGPVCTVVAGCTGAAVLQAQRSCNTCGGETANLRSSVDKRRRELVDLEQREDAIKSTARARDGQCGCSDPSSHDGSPPEKPKRAKTAADHVYEPQPCPQPQSGDLSEAEVFELRIIANSRQDAGRNLEQLEAAIARTAKEHTHPVFACQKHQRRLST